MTGIRWRPPSAYGLPRLSPSMMAKLVNDITETRSDKEHEGARAGHRQRRHRLLRRRGELRDDRPDHDQRARLSRPHRISTFASGAFLLILVGGLGNVVAVITMASLVAVMSLVAASTSDWHSVARASLRPMPVGEPVIMLARAMVRGGEIYAGEPECGCAPRR
jgi:SulP family sulfate permease